MLRMRCNQTTTTTVKVLKLSMITSWTIVINRLLSRIVAKMSIVEVIQLARNFLSEQRNWRNTKNQTSKWPRPNLHWNSKKFFQRGYRDETDKSIITSPGSQFDLFSGKDINLIIYFGCPKSFGPVSSAGALILASGIEFNIRQLHLEPFSDVYGPSFIKASLFPISEIPIRDLNNKDAVITFYITRGKSFILFRNNSLHKYNQMEKDKILRVPKDSHEFVLLIYTEYQDDGSHRTYLFAMPTETKEFRSYVLT